MSKVIDARGRSCPEPVIMTKNAIDSFPNEEFEVLVDAKVAVENIKRFAKSKGYDIKVDSKGNKFTLHIKK